MEVNEVRKNVVRSHICQNEMLAQLAEEAVELAQAALDMPYHYGSALAKSASRLSHAALKLRRTLSPENPTPITTEEAVLKVREEVADVLLCLDVLNINVTDPTIGFIQEQKLARWIRRLEGGEDA